MSFNNPVNPDDEVVFSASKENAIIRATNSKLDVLKQPPDEKIFPQYVTVVGYNASDAGDDTTIPTGCAVELSEYYNKTGLFAIIPISESTTKQWGILLGTVPAKSTGSVLLSGVTSVILSEIVAVGDKIVPDVEKKGKFKKGSGRAIVLSKNDDDLTAVIYLEASSSGSVKMAAIADNPAGAGECTVRVITPAADGNYIIADTTTASTSLRI